MRAKLTLGVFLVSDKAIAILAACVKSGGSEQAWKHHHSTIGALMRRGLVSLSTTGSYLNGGPVDHWIDITAEGRSIFELTMMGLK